MDTVNKNTKIKISFNANDLLHAAAEEFTQSAMTAVDTKGVFRVALSGGKTAKSFFDVLTSDKLYSQKIPWRQIQFFFGDERYLPQDDPENNYYTAKKHLFLKVPVLEENIYPIPTGFADPRDAAKEYELILRRTFQINHHEFPKFDLVMLGLGSDAHTASLMPFSDLVISYIKKPMSFELVASLWVPQLKMHRITLTPPAINNKSKLICFMVTGENKASAVCEVLIGPSNPEQCPAQLIDCIEGETIWYLDQAAASQLPDRGI